MVSGLVTSPCDQLRIFSGDAREMRIESKSAIKFARSYGEDLKIASNQNPCNRRDAETQRRILVFSASRRLGGESLIRRQRRIGDLSRLLHQLHVKAERLQFANQNVERFRYARL